MIEKGCVKSGSSRGRRGKETGEEM